MLAALTISSLGAWHPRSLQSAPVTLQNGVDQALELQASQYAFYQVVVPTGGLPLELSLTELAGSAGLFAGTSNEQPDASDSSAVRWALTGESSSRTLTIPAIPTLVRSNSECGSDDTLIGAAGTFDDVAGCAAACSAHEGCHFFIFGTGTKAGACYMENTSDNSCAEGFEEDEFDFYELGTGGIVHIGVVGYSDTSLTLTASWGQAPVRLRDGVPVAGTVARGASSHFTVHGPGNAADLALALTVQYGNADMYVKTGSAPTTSPGGFFWSAKSMGDDRIAIGRSDAHFCADCEYHVTKQP